MATFGGTTQKCAACGKTVYLVDQLVADDRFFHEACFRCHHCKRTLKVFGCTRISMRAVICSGSRLGNYSSFESVLYCKPHYDQLLKVTGSLNKSFEGVPRYAKTERYSDREGYSNNRISSLFVGTQDKCVVCKKTVYPIEKVAVDGNSFHRPCFKCFHGGCTISPSNYIAHDGKLYCRHHHSQLFKTKGNFSQLEHKHEEVRARVKIQLPDDEIVNHAAENGIEIA